jgi:microcystin-dependent protein
MNDNQILECGGIEVQDNGITVKNFINIIAGTNDNDVSPGGLMSKFIRTASSGTYTVDYQVAGDSTEFGDRTWQDARYVYNPGPPNTFSQVWGIVTSSNITPVGSTIGDIHFYNSVYVDGNIGIGTTNPSTTLDVAGDIFASAGFITQNTRYLDDAKILYGYNINSTILEYYYDNISDFDTLEIAPAGGSRSQIKFNTATSGSPTQASTQMILSHDGRLGVGTTTPSYKLDVNGVGQIPSLIVSSITTTAPSLNISTIGNLNITGNLNVGGAINHPDVAPVGSILMYAASSVPNGWLLCDGGSYPTVDYPELFSVISYDFGGSVGNFNVPNMQQRFPVGVGSGYSMGQTGGFVSTTLTTNELPSHSHTITDPGHTHQIKCNCDTGGEYVLDDETNGAPGYYTSQSATTGITINNTGSGLPFDNRPPYFAINYIIKY